MFTIIYSAEIINETQPSILKTHIILKINKYKTKIFYMCKKYFNI